MTLESTILDYYSIVPRGDVPEPRSSFLSLLSKMLMNIGRLTEYETPPTPKSYPNDVIIQFPHIPTNHELRDPRRPFTYFFDLLIAVVERMHFDEGQERTYHLLLDPGSFGSVLTSLANIYNIDGERQAQLDEHPRPQSHKADIKVSLVEYATVRLGPKGYRMLGTELRYFIPDPEVTVIIRREKTTVP